jgi:hypothetical protein
MKIDKEYIKMIHYTVGCGSHPESKIEITIDSQSTLTEVIESFENFLKACGYVFNGHLDIVQDEEYSTDNLKDL